MPFTTPEYYKEAIDYMIQYSHYHQFDFLIDCATKQFVEDIKSLYTDQLLLERTNLNEEEKNKIYRLNWSNERIEEIYNCEEITLIRIGNNDYITQMNQNLKNMNVKSINIIDCYNINEENIEIAKIREKYEKVLNTKNLEK